MATTERKQAHGLTGAEMRELQAQQIAEEAPKMVKGSKDKKHFFPAAEKHLVHVRLQTGGFNAETGQPNSTPRVQTFDAKEFVRMEKENAFAGMKVEILHDPTGEAEPVEPTDYLQAQVVSQPGAGTPLTETLEDYQKKSVKELRAKFDELYPERKAESASMNDKKVLISEISDRLTFLAAESASETEAEALKRQEQARIDAAAGGNA
jgi:hypothetical protein